MSDKTTLIVTATPNSNEQESMQAYLKGVMPLLMQAGGQLIKRVKVVSAVAADSPFGMAMVMDFPDQQSVDTMFSSGAYKALIPAREKGFSSMTICIAQDL